MCIRIETDVRIEQKIPLCPYCDDSLAIVKGGPNVNGLHGECAELVAIELDASAPVFLIDE